MDSGFEDAHFLSLLFSCKLAQTYLETRNMHLAICAWRCQIETNAAKTLPSLCLPGAKSTGV